MRIEGTNRLSDDLFMEQNKKSKAKYEIRKENGYIRHYVTKANGEVVMIKETQLPKSEQQEQNAGEIQGQMTELAMQQLSNVFNREHMPQLKKTGLAMEKEIEKYGNSI